MHVPGIYQTYPIGRLNVYPKYIHILAYLDESHVHLGLYGRDKVDVATVNCHPYCMRALEFLVGVACWPHFLSRSLFRKFYTQQCSTFGLDSDARQQYDPTAESR